MREISHPLLLTEVRRFGVFNAHGCYNCGGCTIGCELATGSTTFPRRTMQTVVLGLRESARHSLDAWLCHDCGECSTACPRGAEPRESMITLRRYLTAEYDWTGLSRRIAQSRVWEIASLSVAALAVLALIILYHLYIAGLDAKTLRTTALGLDHMFPRILYFTWAVFLIPALFLISHAIRMFVFTMRRGPERSIPFRYYAAEAKTLFLQMVTQGQILKCPATIHKRRWLLHWLLATGCTAMFAIKFFFLRWFQTDKLYAIYHPQRWVGYLAAAFLLAGAVDILVSRYQHRKPLHAHSEFSDWMLPLLISLTALSGIAVHVFRYTGMELSSHYLYAAHLMIAVPMLLVEVPFGKSSHMLYRPLALYLEAVRQAAIRAGEMKEGKAA